MINELREEGHNIEYSKTLGRYFIKKKLTVKFLP